jgi:ABC-type multidrug transport system fused ATPase/permease subunit
MTLSDPPAATPLPTRPARPGLFGGLVSSKQRPRPRLEGGPAGAKEAAAEKPPFSVSLREAWELVKARKGRIAIGLGLMAVNRAAGLVLPGASKFLLDDVITQGHRELLGPILLGAGLATLFQAVTSFSLSQLLGIAAQRSITDLRRQVQRHVGRLPVSYYDKNKTGVLLSRVMNDAEGIRNLVGTGLVEIAGSVVTAILAFGILLYFSVKLTLVVAGVLSLFAVVLALAFRTLRPLFRERSKINAELSGRLTESLSGVRVVKAYGSERRESLIFAKGAHRLFRTVAKTMKTFSMVSATSTLLLGTVGIAMMGIGGREVLAGRMSVGSFVAFTMYLALLVGPVVQIVNIGSQISEAFAGLERIREIRSEPTETEGETEREPLPEIVGTVEFRDVSFEYQSDNPVLHDVSFVARPGTVTALVGPSGSGKSTLIGLVAAFHRTTSGQVLIDGRDLSNLRLVDYRSHLGVVFQDNFLFDGTVLENIAYAKPHATEEDVFRAAKIAHCDDFVNRLPNGYDTIVGERGVKLSGGERQRVAIARAILADPRLLILDEATSSLDSESEAFIQEGLNELMRGRTTFVIAHRLSTIRRADTILVLEGGRVVERGRHEELLALGGRYHALYTRQYDLENNRFLNPGETEVPAEQKDGAEKPAVRAADAGVGKVPFLS